MTTWQFPEIIGNSHTVQLYAISWLKQYLCDLDIGLHADLQRFPAPLLITNSEVIMLLKALLLTSACEQRYQVDMFPVHFTAIAWLYIDGLVQACSISIANALEILQSCTKPSIQRLLLHDGAWLSFNTHDSQCWWVCVCLPLPCFDNCDKVHRRGHSYLSSDWIIVLGWKYPRGVNTGHVH